MKRYFQNVIFAALSVMAMLQPAFASASAPAFVFNKRSLLFPASGYRNRTSGGLNNVGSNGYCWSSASISRTNAYNLNFNSGNVNPLNNNNRANGFSLRPVRAYISGSFSLSQIPMQLSRKDLHDLLIAAYLDARRNERTAPSQLRYELNLEDNIRNLADRIYTRQWRPAPQICFVITHPTVREVFAPAFEDRIVSHLLFNMLAPLAERTFIYDSYSCRKGKGTLFGIERFEHFLRGATKNWAKTAYVLSVDISGYFMHINKAILYSLVCDMLSVYSDRDCGNGKKWSDVIDYRVADYLAGTIIFRNPTDNCIRIGSHRDWEPLPPQKSQFNSPLGTGITIGDVMSQLFSNIYLNPFDQFCKRDLHLKRYGRYVDDARAIDADGAYLESCIPTMGEYLRSNLKLSLHPAKTKVVPTRGENIFLGADCRPYRRYAATSTIKHFKCAVYDIEKSLCEGTADYNNIVSRLNSYLGYLQHFREYRQVSRTLGDSALNNILTFSPNYRKANLSYKLNTSDYAQIHLC